MAKNETLAANAPSWSASMSESDWLAGRLPHRFAPMVDEHGAHLFCALNHIGVSVSAGPPKGKGQRASLRYEIRRDGVSVSARSLQEAVFRLLSLYPGQQRLRAQVEQWKLEDDLNDRKNIPPRGGWSKAVKPRKQKPKVIRAKD